LGVLLFLMLAGAYFILRSVTRELEVARLQSEFVAAVSHEFRTPLASLLQMSELLAEGRVAEHRRPQYYEVLRRETARLQRLVESLLDFARMEAAAREYRMEPVDADALVRDVAGDFQREVAERGYSLELTTNGASSRLQADPEALSRALWNLLENAVKYSPAHKTIWVESATENSHYVIRVRDRGLGIAREEQERVFEKFVRASSARTVAARGTGLGLAMVRHIVTAHGGQVRVQSEPGAGSTFSLSLPVEKEA
jgi:signal transduction histidine kinase